MKSAAADGIWRHPRQRILDVMYPDLPVVGPLLQGSEYPGLARLHSAVLQALPAIREQFVELRQMLQSGLADPGDLKYFDAATHFDCDNNKEERAWCRETGREGSWTEYSFMRQWSQCSLQAFPTACQVISEAIGQSSMDVDTIIDC
ncbi:unnamed protein product [Polarella glacialis]|uniref:Uncharacterized protein n=1 Tax=Polarella glacialis TaxID=89957 RepID=A0A813J7Y4_POLGL|nr:unnamed protein product [Polarella glacialis]